MTTATKIRQWLERGQAQGASHCLIAWDMFDGAEGDYPIYVTSRQAALEEIARFSNPRQADKLIEVYDLKLDLDDQLLEYRAWHV